MEEIQFKYGTKLQSDQKSGEGDIGLNGGIVNPTFDNKNANDWDIIEPRFSVRLEDVFWHYKVPLIIDYFLLHVEGVETYIMFRFPFDSYRIKVMTVEHPKTDLVALLQKNGYIFLGYLSGWGESLWCHESIKPTLNLLGIPLFESAFLPTITSGAGQNTTPHLEPHNMK